MCSCGDRPSATALITQRFKEKAMAQQYVELDGKTHVLAEGSVRTVCYLEVPYATDWTSDEPAKLCKECAEKTKDDGKA